ncbi:ABC transporter permease [Serinibacter salmoneus]|uniref:ABC-2 type transport system permease protein n=1 Tax=Serinibacter salmoneus TaxID=556530 RepID=A0A2A9D0U3_9MICO|nr:ABC transporter permease [Serinibacter salmoneus]PFG19460.1 ABC-2 type transport system permease protein [Serinibacter salmoneus]
MSAASRVLAHGRFELVGSLRNGEQLLVSLVLPALVLVGLGAWDTVMLTLPEGAARIDVVVPGVLALAIVSAGFTSLAIATAFERRWGVLRQLATTPLGPSGIVAGKSLGVAALVVAQCAVLGALGFATGWRPDLAAWPAAVALVALGVATFTCLGLLVAATLRAEGVLAVANLAWVLMAAGGGLVLPLDSLPSGLASAVSLLPSGALGEGLRDALIDGSAPVAQILTLAAWSVVSALAARRWFRPSE